METRLTQSQEKDYLFSENPTERAFGRLTATSIMEDIHKWINAELARGTEPEDIIVLLSNFFVSIHASVVGSWFEKSEINRGRKVFTQIIDQTYRKVALVSFDRTADSRES